jgi:hypothetical protein
MPALAAAVAIGTAVSFWACGGEDALATPEATEVLNAALESDTPEGLMSGSVELGALFDLGQSIPLSAQALAGRLKRDIPCAVTTPNDTGVLIDFGAAGDCRFNGLPLSGTIRIEIEKTGLDSAQVTHTWTTLGNGRIQINGTATVLWSANTRSRRVVHSVTWRVQRFVAASRSFEFGPELSASGDRTQTLLDADAGIGGGIVINGDREWTRPSGTFSLAIDNIEVRWSDPAPQSGRYTLTTPRGRVYGVAYERLDADRIRATVSRGDVTDPRSAGQRSFILGREDGTIIATPED